MVKSSYHEDFNMKDANFDDNVLGINSLLCLPKADLKNSTKQLQLSFGWVFGIQIDSLEKNLFTLAPLPQTLNFGKKFKFVVGIHTYQNLTFFTLSEKTSSYPIQEADLDPLMWL